MRRGILVLIFLLLGTTFFVQEAVAATGSEAPAGEAAAPAKASAGIDNLFVEAGGGVMSPHNEDSTMLGFGSVNYGFALAKDFGLGAQVGAKATLRKHDPDWLASAGLFQRGLDVGGLACTWAVQGTYLRTWEGADLLGVKPTLGAEIDKDNYVALTGAWGLNSKQVGPAVSDKQLIVTQALVVWGSAWADNFVTELGAGYEFHDVNSAQLAGHAAYKVNDMMNVNLTADVDFEGNYYAGVSLGFDLGGNGRNGTLNNITKDGVDDYTPFSLGSLPVMFYQSKAAAPAAGGGGDGGDGEP